MDVEICINCDSEQPVAASVSAAYQGGAARIELCSAMHEDGLTPSIEQIQEARMAFRNRSGVLVMIRPRAGDFSYSPQEILKIHTQIRKAADAGADGVVFGVLDKSGLGVAFDTLQELIATCREFGLETTFHRAFDAIPNSTDALMTLKRAGIHRILTSGMPWGERGTALDGVAKLRSLIQEAGRSVEIVVGGGIDETNISKILSALPLQSENISLHAFSGAQENGRVTAQAVKNLVVAAGHSNTKSIRS